MSDDKSKLEAAEARANEAEANMRQAAQFGKDLLDQLNDSKARNGDLEQKVHSLKFELTSAQANAQNLTEEVAGIHKSQAQLTLYFYVLLEFKYFFHNSFRLEQKVN